MMWSGAWPRSDTKKQVILTGQDLEDGGEEEAAALDQPEELVEEGDEGEDAEEDGEDHEGLNRLDPVWKRVTRGVRVKIHTYRDSQHCNLRLISAGANLHRSPACSGTLCQLSCSRTTDLCFYPHLQTRSGNSNNKERMKILLSIETKYHHHCICSCYLHSK